MRSLVESLLIAVVGAVLIIIILLLLGVSIGYRDEIKRRNIDFYARIIAGLIFFLITLYLYIYENPESDILFIGIIWILLVIFCTDWKRLRSTDSKVIEGYSHVS